MRGAAALLILTGCYAELGGGYFPSVKQTLTPAAGVPTSASTSGWAIAFKLGFYIDVPLSFIKSGIGLGLSLPGLGGDPVLPKDAPAKVTPRGTELRGDVVLPFVIASSVPNLVARATVIYTAFASVGVKRPGDADYQQLDGASGSTWFVGPSIGWRKKGTGINFSLGYQHLSSDVAVNMTAGEERDGIETSGWGPAARLMINWVPSFALFKHYTPSPITPQQRGNAGCYYRTQCDYYGWCRSDYYCP